MWRGGVNGIDSLPIAVFQSTHRGRTIVSREQATSAHFKPAALC